jgi:DNA-binding transcriptional regulator YiaG
MRHQIDGGTYRTVVEKNFDLEPYIGFPARVEHMPVLRCSECGDRMIPGAAIDRAMALAGETVAVSTSARLTARQAIFLRKHMGLTQGELAQRMGCDRGTVAKWETRGFGISKPYDLILRVLFLTHLHDKLRDRLAGSSTLRIRQAIEHVGTVLSALSHVRDAAPPHRARPVVIRATAAELGKEAA